MTSIDCQKHFRIRRRNSFTYFSPLDDQTNIDSRKRVKCIHDIMRKYNHNLGSNIKIRYFNSIYAFRGKFFIHMIFKNAKCTITIIISMLLFLIKMCTQKDVKLNRRNCIILACEMFRPKTNQKMQYVQ